MLGVVKSERYIIACGIVYQIKEGKFKEDAVVSFIPNMDDGKPIAEGVTYVTRAKTN